MYPLNCTLYCCTLTPTLTHRQSSARVALSPAFISDFCFKFHSVHSIGYATTFTALFACDSVQKSTVSFSKFSFLLEVSRELTQRSTLNTFFHCSQFSCCSFALAYFLLCVCHIFVSSPNLLPYSGFHFLFLVGGIPSTLWRAGYTPADRQTSRGVLHHLCTVPVYKLLSIRQ